MNESWMVYNKNMTNKIKYSTDKIFWTNSSENKPSLEIINSLTFIEMEIANITPKNDFGYATFNSVIPNISYVLWNNKYYLVEEYIESNNQVLIYTIALDIWIAFTLPFLENEKNILLNRSTAFYNALIKDEILDNLPLTYKPKEKKQITLPKPVWPDKELDVNKSHKIAYLSKNFTELGDNWLIETAKLDTGNIYFAMSVTSDSSASGTYFVELYPVLNYGTITKEKTAGGTTYKLKNSYEVLLKWATNTTNINRFLGVFKGTELGYDGSFEKYGYIEETPGDVDVFLGKIVGYNNKTNISHNLYISQYKYNFMAKYNLYTFGTTTVDYIEKFALSSIFSRARIDHNFIFTGAGFVGSLENTLDTEIQNTFINNGGELISTKASYNTYVNANKSSLNAQTKWMDVDMITGSASSLIGAGVSAMTGNVIGAGMSGIGMLTSVGGYFKKKDMFNANLNDRKASNNVVISTTDTIDNVLANIMANGLENVAEESNNFGFVYIMQELDTNSMNLLINQIEKYGTATTYIAPNFQVMKSNGYNETEIEKNYFFVLDLESISLGIDKTGLNLLIKNLIKSMLSGGIRVWKISP